MICIGIKRIACILAFIVTPLAEALDRWFEDLQVYERSLEDMANASMDQNFKEELQHVEQWFRFLSEAERTAAVYSLLQLATPVQARFYVTVLQQMGKTDPVGALLSPANPEKGNWSFFSIPLLL